MLLKNDKELAAQKVYEYYLLTQIDKLEPSQKETILDTLNENNRLSSHLAQSILLSDSSLENKIESTKIPKINDFDDLEMILEHLPQYSKLAMNQANLLPSEINPDTSYGIEIEAKLAGANNARIDSSKLKKKLEVYKQFIELGTDYNDQLAELRTLKGGFKLNKESQKAF